MTQKCRICQLDKSCSSLNLNSEDGEEYSLYVCSTCWDIIAQIAINLINHLMKVNPAGDPVLPPA